MDEQPLNVTRHARKRMKERGGIGRKSSQRMAAKIFDTGIRHAETTGQLNKFISKLYCKHHNANNIRVYGDFAYIFCGRNLITVIPIPDKIKKNMSKMVKRPATEEAGN